MSRWGDWNAKNRELWEESQCLYPDGINPYYLEFQCRYCCVKCKTEIRAMQGCYWQASTELQWHVGCKD
jgi:hypothetical protein